MNSSRLSINGSLFLANPAEKKKAKQRQAEKMEMTAVSLEEMLGERTAEQTLWKGDNPFRLFYPFSVHETVLCC